MNQTDEQTVIDITQRLKFLTRLQKLFAGKTGTSGRSGTAKQRATRTDGTQCTRSSRYATKLYRRKRSRAAHESRRINAQREKS